MKSLREARDNYLKNNGGNTASEGVSGTVERPSLVTARNNYLQNRQQGLINETVRRYSQIEYEKAARKQRENARFRQSFYDYAKRKAEEDRQKAAAERSEALDEYISSLGKKADTIKREKAKYGDSLKYGYAENLVNEGYSLDDIIAETGKGTTTKLPTLDNADTNAPGTTGLRNITPAESGHAWMFDSKAEQDNYLRGYAYSKMLLSDLEKYDEKDRFYPMPENEEAKRFIREYVENYKDSSANRKAFDEAVYKSLDEDTARATVEYLNRLDEVYKNGGDVTLNEGSMTVNPGDDSQLRAYYINEKKRENRINDLNSRKEEYEVYKGNKDWEDNNGYKNPTGNEYSKLSGVINRVTGTGSDEAQKAVIDYLSYAKAPVDYAAEYGSQDGELGYIYGVVSGTNEKNNETGAPSGLISTLKGSIYDPELLNYINAEEKKMLYYLHNTGRNAEFREYWTNYLEDALKIRYDDSVNKSAYNAGKYAPVISSVMSVYTKPYEAVEGAVGFIRSVTGSGADEVASGQRLTQINQEIRNSVTENIDSPVGEFLYGVGMSMADVAWNLAVSSLAGGAFSALTNSNAVSSGANGVRETVKKAENMSLVLMSSEAASNELYNQMKAIAESGDDSTKARVNAVVMAGVAGFAEYITERVSIESFLSNPKNILLASLKQLTAEGAEEIASDVINTLSDDIINGGASEINLRIGELMANGKMSKKDASRQALTEWLKQTGYDGLAGAVSGLFFGGFGSVSDDIVARTYYKETAREEASNVYDKGNGAVESAFDYGLNYGEGNKVSKYAAKVLGQSETSGENISEKQLSKLLYKEINDKSAQVDFSGEGVFAKADDGGALVKLGESYVPANEISNANLSPAMSQIYNTAISMTDADGNFDADGANNYISFYDGSDVSLYNAVYNYFAESGKSGMSYADAKAVIPDDYSAMLEEVSEEARLNAWRYGQQINYAESERTKNIATTGIISITDIKNIRVENGETVIETKGGESVPASKANITDERLKSLVRSAAVYPSDVASGFVALAYGPDTKALSYKQYADAFSVIYNAGREGIDISVAENQPSYKTLGKIATQVYDLGVKFRNVETAAKSNDNTSSVTYGDTFPKAEGKTESKAKVKGKNKVGVLSDDNNLLNDSAKAFLSAVADTYGFDIAVFDKLEDGSMGEYVKSLNRINLANGKIMSELLHELGHVIRVADENSYLTMRDTYRDYVIAKYGASHYNALIDNVMERYGDVSTDYAEEEVVCDSLVALQKKKGFAEDMAKTLYDNGYSKNKIKKFFRTVAEFFRKMADMVRSLFDSETVTQAGVYAERDAAFLDKLSDSFFAGMRKVAEYNFEGVDGETRKMKPTGKHNVFGFELYNNANVNYDLLEELSIYHPEAKVEPNGNIIVYHRTSEENANIIKSTGIMTAKEDALFFSSKESGYADGYGDTVLTFSIPSTVLEVNDIFDGEVHFDIPLKMKNGKFSLNVSKYILNDDKIKDKRYMLPEEQAELDRLKSELERKDAELAESKIEHERYVRTAEKTIKAKERLIQTYSEALAIGAGGNVVSFESVKDIVRGLNERYDLRLSLSDDVSELTKIYSHIANAKNTNSGELLGEIRQFVEKRVIPASFKIDDSLRRQYKGFLRDVRLGVRLNENQVSELCHLTGLPWGKARQKYFGRINFSKDNGEWLDDSFAEWVNSYPELFSENALSLTDADEVGAIINAVERLKAEEVSPLLDSFGDDKLAVEYISNAIFDEYWNAEDIKTINQAKNEGYGKAKREYDAQMSEYKKAAQKEIKLLTEQRDRSVMDFYKYRERSVREDYRARIKKLYKYFSNLVLHPTDSSYAPNGLYKAICEVCSIIDITHNYDTKIGQRLRVLKAQYDTLAKSDDSDYRTEYDAKMSEYINNLAEYFDGKSNLLTMSNEDLADVYNILSEIQHTLVNARKQLESDERMENAALGAEFLSEQKKIKRNVNGLQSNFADILSSMRAINYLSGYENGVMARQFKALEQGEIKGNMWAMQAKRPFEILQREDKGRAFRRFTHDTVKTHLIDTDGNAVELTHAQIVQIVMTSERERRSGHPNQHGQTEYAHRHLFEGGITLPEQKSLEAGKREAALTNAKRVESLSFADVNELAKLLNDYDRQWIAAAEKFFNKDSSKALDHVMFILKHRHMPMSNYYIPFVVNKNFVVSEIEAVSFNASLENAGIYKETKTGAKQPLIIAGIDSVVNDHAKTVAMQYGLAIPLRNLIKVYNVKEVKNYIKTNWKYAGGGKMNIVEQVITDLQKNRKNSDPTIFDKIYSGYVRAVLTGNVSVTLKQMASYESAGIYLRFKARQYGKTRALYTLKNFSKVCDEIDKYTPEHYMRRIGLSHQELGDMTAKYGLWEKKGALQYIKPEKWIQFTDCYTTALLWEATKKEVEYRVKGRKNGVEIGSEEYFKEVAELYNRVIMDTQPMYDVLHRTELMKKNNKFISGLLMFKTVPFQQFGIVADSYGEFFAARRRYLADKSEENKKAYGEAARKLGRANYVTVTACLALGTITVISAFGLRRDKDLRDIYGELTIGSALNALVDSTVSGLISTALPWSPYSEYGITKNPIESTLTDFADGLIKTYNDIADIITGDLKFKDPLTAFKGLFWRGSGFYKTVTKICAMYGLPADNAVKIVDSFVDWGKVSLNGGLNGYYERKPTQYYQAIYDNYMKVKNEDTEKDKKNYKKAADDWYRRARDAGYSPSDIDTGLRKLLSDSEDIEQLGDAYIENRWSDYDRIKKELLSAGFTENQIFGARNNYINSLTEKEEDPDAEGKEIKEYTTDKITEAILSGNEDVIIRFADWFVSNGSKSALTREIKETYIDGDDAVKEKIETALIEWFGYDKETFNDWNTLYQYSDLYDAIKAGDGDMIDKILENFSDVEKSEKGIRNQVTKNLKEYYRTLSGAERVKLQRLLREKLGYPMDYNFNAWLNVDD